MTWLASYRLVYQSQRLPNTLRLKKPFVYLLFGWIALMNIVVVKSLKTRLCVNDMNRVKVEL